MRDDFDKDTKEILARRVAHRCSNPNCKQPTSGPQADSTKAINLGVAAHITAASRGGPRYQDSMSSSERSSALNGIWLCQNCAKLVDNDSARFTIETLQEWKRSAEEEVLASLKGLSSNSKNPLKEIPNYTKYADTIIDSHEKWVKHYTPLLAELREIETFVVPISITTTTSSPSLVTQIPSLGQLSVILGESGAGKTTSLWRIAVEYAQHLKLDISSPIPILVSLKRWSDTNKCRDLVYERLRSLEVSDETKNYLLENGNFVILLDGLNEIPPFGNQIPQAYEDILGFMLQYNHNTFVVCCRTSDYEFSIFETFELREFLEYPQVYEIKRLDRSQIIDYILRNFEEDPSAAEDLLTKLNVNIDETWNDRKSILYLACIPLYLQLIIIEYRRTQNLPSNKSQLIQTLVQATFDRENRGASNRLNRLAKERLLSSMAFKSVQRGFSLRAPRMLIENVLIESAEEHKQLNLIPNLLMIEDIWRELQSNNFLRIIDLSWIEWLHQLIFDYFVANKIMIMFTNDTASHLQIAKPVARSIWEQPFTIALELLPPSIGGSLLERLLQISAKIARSVFSNLETNLAWDISDKMIDGIMARENLEVGQLRNAGITLPYLPIVEKLFQLFRYCNEQERIYIAEAVAELVVTNSSSAQNEVLERAQQLLTSWSGNRNHYVRFYAAKGLWGTDRGLSASIFNELNRVSDDHNLNRKIQDLAADWNIE